MHGTSKLAKRVAVGLLLATAVDGQSIPSMSHRHAWGENIGWTVWRSENPSNNVVVLHDGYLQGWVWGENVGWICVGNGPADGVAYANLDGADFGVNVDSMTGDLSGLAWGENIGWINFNTQSHGDDRARFDVPEMRFRGYAWGENIGWINLDDDFHFVGMLPQVLQGCPNDFVDAANGAGGERLSRFGCVAAPQPPALAGGVGTAIRVVFRTLYNTTAGNPDGPSVCVSRSLLSSPQPSLSQFEGQTRWLGSPVEIVDEATPTPPNYIGAPLVCTAAEAAVRDWSAAALAAEFGGDADSAHIYFYDAAVVPCSVYEVSHCSDPLDEGTCSDPVLILTSRMADAWPPFEVLGQPNFTDINALVSKYKGIPFSPGSTPQGGPPEWHALLSGDVFSLGSRLTSFLDISVGVDGYKGLPYKERGPCDPDTATDTCGNACSPAP